MKKIYQNESLEWSNIFFLIPLFISIFYGLYLYSVIIFIVFIVSFDFHFFNQAKQVYYLDITFSSILMLSNLTLLILGHLLFPYYILAIISALTALYLYFKENKENYYLNHSLWHFFSAIVCIFCLLTYISYIQ